MSARPIGELLTEAGLISEGQLQAALYDQQLYQDLRLGEILSLRGWIKQETADFLVSCISSTPQALQLPLGQCFCQAGLLDEDQLSNVLQEQRVNHMRFGAIAVLKGYISQNTLDFFLKHFFPEQKKQGQYFQGNSSQEKPASAVDTYIQTDSDDSDYSHLTKGDVDDDFEIPWAG